VLQFDQCVKTENQSPYTSKRVVWKKEQTVLRLGYSDDDYGFLQER